MKLLSLLKEEESFEEDDDFVTGTAKYSVTYETWSYDDLEVGDTDERGFISEDVTIENIDDLDSLIYDINNLSDTSWSSYPINSDMIVKGRIWITGLYNEDIRTGEREYRSFHFDNFSKKEAEYLLRSVGKMI